MSWFDDEALAVERLDADLEQAELEAAGREFARSLGRMHALRAAGDDMGAAKACEHGGGYPLDSLAASEGTCGHVDPFAGGRGWRCRDCGSRLSSPPWEEDYTILAPCEMYALFNEEAAHAGRPADEDRAGGRKTYPMKCRVCGREFNHESEFLAGSEATSDGRLLGTCNMEEGLPHHSREEIVASYEDRLAEGRR